MTHFSGIIYIWNCLKFESGFTSEILFPQFCWMHIYKKVTVEVDSSLGA